MPIEPIVSAGGLARNAPRLQATADATGLPVRSAVEENLTIVGTAAAAATGVARDGRLMEPDLAAHRLQAEALERYREATACLTPILHGLSTGRTPAAAAAG